MGKKRGSVTQQGCMKDRGPTLELCPSRDVFTAGGQLCGVAVLRLAKETSVSSLSVSVSGRETPKGRSLSRRLGRSSCFFKQEAVFVGMARRRSRSERMAHYWNIALGRDDGRTLSAGEHIYPFCFALPASLPPSYSGRAGRITYSVSVRAESAHRRKMNRTVECAVVCMPRAVRGRPVAISYPNTPGATHDSEIRITLDLAQRAVETGKSIRGHFEIENPRGVEISQVLASLEKCEWVRSAPAKELELDRVDSATITPDSPTAPLIRADFDLVVPEDACPTVEGTAIAVLWLLRVSLGTSPPFEFKTPITVYKSGCEPDVD